MDTNSEKTHLSSKLRSIGFRILGMAHLIQNQRPDPVSPLDLEDRYHGIGEVLDDLGAQIQSIAAELEAIDARRGSE